MADFERYEQWDFGREKSLNIPMDWYLLPLFKLITFAANDNERTASWQTIFYNERRTIPTRERFSIFDFRYTRFSFVISFVLQIQVIVQGTDCPLRALLELYTEGGVSLKVVQREVFGCEIMFLAKYHIIVLYLNVRVGLKM